jgi:hypothetical protein
MTWRAAVTRPCVQTDRQRSYELLIALLSRTPDAELDTDQAPGPALGSMDPAAQLAWSHTNSLFSSTCTKSQLSFGQITKLQLTTSCQSTDQARELSWP